MFKTKAIIAGSALMLFGLAPLGAIAATTKAVVTVKAPVKAPVKAVVKAPVKKVVKKVVKKKVVVNKKLAEGTDKSKAAKATAWKGLVIGMNEGERSLVITEAPKLDHINAYAQRSILVSVNTQITSKAGEQINWQDLDIGKTLYVTGNYNAATRVIKASNIEVK